MQLPERIRKYPLISAAVGVVLMIALLVALTWVLAQIAETFGADNVWRLIERQFPNGGNSP